VDPVQALKHEIS
jgi:hypothetical protein